MVTSKENNSNANADVNTMRATIEKLTMLSRKDRAILDSIGLSVFRIIANMLVSYANKFFYSTLKTTKEVVIKNKINSVIPSFKLTWDDISKNLNKVITINIGNGDRQYLIIPLAVANSKCTEVAFIELASSPSDPKNNYDSSAITTEMSSVAKIHGLKQDIDDETVLNYISYWTEQLEYLTKDKGFNWSDNGELMQESIDAKK